jgi:hypothetical protein
VPKIPTRTIGALATGMALSLLCGSAFAPGPQREPMLTAACASALIAIACYLADLTDPRQGP